MAIANLIELYFLCNSFKDKNVKEILDHLYDHKKYAFLRHTNSSQLNILYFSLSNSLSLYPININDFTFKYSKEDKKNIHNNLYAVLKFLIELSDLKFGDHYTKNLTYIVSSVIPLDEMFLLMKLYDRSCYLLFDDILNLNERYNLKVNDVIKIFNNIKENNYKLSFKGCTMIM